MCLQTNMATDCDEGIIQENFMFSYHILNLFYLGYFAFKVEKKCFHTVFSAHV